VNTRCDSLPQMRSGWLLQRRPRLSTTQHFAKLIDLVIVFLIKNIRLRGGFGCDVWWSGGQKLPDIRTARDAPRLLLPPRILVGALRAPLRSQWRWERDRRAV